MIILRAFHSGLTLAKLESIELADCVRSIWMDLTCSDSTKPPHVCWEQVYILICTIQYKYKQLQKCMPFVCIKLRSPCINGHLPTQWWCAPTEKTLWWHIVLGLDILMEYCWCSDTYWYCIYIERAFRTRRYPATCAAGFMSMCCFSLRRLQNTAVTTWLCCCSDRSIPHNYCTHPSLRFFKWDRAPIHELLGGRSCVKFFVVLAVHPKIPWGNDDARVH